MSNQKEPVEINYSPEEKAEMRERMTNYYNDQLPLLRLQAEHQKLIAEIEQNRFVAMDMVKRQAYLNAEFEKEVVPEPTPKQERKLQTPG